MEPLLIHSSLLISILIQQQSSYRLTSTTRIHFVFAFSFKFVNPFKVLNKTTVVEMTSLCNCPTNWPFSHYRRIICIVKGKGITISVICENLSPMNRIVSENYFF